MRMNISKESVASIIDHTLLKQDASEDQIRKLCQEAKQYGFASVCINPCYVPLAARELSDSSVSVCTVIGFPLGASASQVKAFEARQAIGQGADEIDMVINVGWIKSGRWNDVTEDIRAVTESAHRDNPDTVVKVIIETCLLTDQEKICACQAAQKAGADFVKTSTGFSTGGATAEDVSLMRRTVGPHMGIKAAGGIHTAEEASALIRAGASRLGASAGISILNSLPSEE